MENGLDKQQIEDVKKWLANLVADPVRLRLYICLLLLAVGWLGVVRPLGQRLAVAQTDLKKSKTTARRAGAAAHYVGQRKLYEPKLTNRPDVVFWQAYVMHKLDAAGAVLSSLEPSASISKFQFKIVRMMLTARANHYQDIVDFIDRVEHGELAVRVETIAIDETTDDLLFTCMLQCLVKPSLKLAGNKPVASNDDGDDGDDGDERDDADVDQSVLGHDESGPDDEGSATLAPAGAPLMQDDPEGGHG
ncbi:MAG: hypothetical protein DRQ55_01990 [Planctomycetota bacterium]|nr:MAG: hypothetical protein DRQ55_01990 [Planctomycetota bacterium]